MPENQLSGYRALRKGRFSEPGRIYFLTTVTRDREPLFRDFRLGRQVVRELRRVHDDGRVRSWAHVVMPDHLHWLVELVGNDTLSGVMQEVKARSAKGVNRARASPGHPVWQPGFHDRALRDGASLRRVGRYLVANPLRAGLVARLGDYPLWDAVWLGGDGQPDPLM